MVINLISPGIRVRNTEVAVDNVVRRKLSRCDIVVIELPELVSPVAGRPRKSKFHERAAPSSADVMTEMAVATCDIGLIGLAVMGQNLVLNMNDHGYKVAVFNRTVSKVDEFMNQ